MTIQISAYATKTIDSPLESGAKTCPTCESPNLRVRLTAPDRFHLRNVPYCLLMCLECSSVWLQNPPLEAQMGEHYSASYHGSITRSGAASRLSRWKRQSARVLRLKPSGRLLDIGCSSGAFLETMRGPKWNLSGIEIDPAQAELARANSGANIFVGDPIDTQVEPQSFDVITCFHVIEHHAQPQELMKNIWRWLKPQGYLYIAIPNIASWEARFFGTYWYGLELPRHLYHYSPESLHRLGQSAEFKIVDISTPSESYSEHSLRYVVDDIARNFGFNRRPLSDGLPASIPLKIVRRIFRLGIETPLARIAGLAGAGASIDAVLQKP
jgi:SAM-dependent methyltransferase